MSNFQMVQGNSVPNLEGIEEGYCVRRCESFFHITVNSSAENIDSVFRALCGVVREPGFLLLEHGTNRKLEDELRATDADPFHKDVYYLDGLQTASFFRLMDPYMDLLVNDGEICYGFGSHQGTDEVYVGPYKIFHIYTDEPEKYRNVLSARNFREKSSLKTVWENFTPEAPGSRMTVTRGGMDIYQMVELLLEKGLYLGERRVEE